MTPGVSKETLDGSTLQKLEAFSDNLKGGKFKFSPSRRVWIPKPGKKEKRPAPPMEKVVQKAIQIVLEAVYEPSFLECSHGFRPSMGTHTALKIVDLNFKKCNWVVEADITKCFDSISHSTLLKILRKRIRCEKT
jgi:RNA-directed DNA polymerase